MPPLALRIHRVAALVLFTTLAFCCFFQANKEGALRAVNPFLDDPYDAVGSFAVQIALLVGVLTYARGLRLRHDHRLLANGHLVVRGGIVVLAAVWVTLGADVVAIAVNGLATSAWGLVLLGGLGLMAVLAAACSAAIYRLAMAPALRSLPVPIGLTLADALDDLWTLVRVPVVALASLLPASLVRWVQQFNSDRCFAHLPWIDPRHHPWRFAAALALLVGIGLTAVQFGEGGPPTLGIALLLATIFVGGEAAATLAGFALFGSYLGLR